jgi:hypothetical protein
LPAVGRSGSRDDGKALRDDGLGVATSTVDLGGAQKIYQRGITNVGDGLGTARAREAEWSGRVLASTSTPERGLTHLEALMAITAFLTSPETPIPFPHEQPDARRSWLMLHARLITPSESTPKVLQFLEASSAVTHLCINEQSARKPAGDVVSFDVAREGATSVLEALRGFGLEHKGAIVVENLDISISESAIRAEEETPGEPADAVVWEQLEQSAGEETRFSVTYLCFMIVATMIAGIGVMLDQPILIVGAMVVGPEFGPLVARCIAIVTRRGQPAIRALGTLALGFAVGMAAAVILTWILTAAGLLNESHADS